MTDRAMAILQVSTHDVSGGAERIAWDLFASYRRLGLRSWLAVGNKWSDDPDVVRIPPPRSGPWRRFWRRAESRLESLGARGIRGAWRLSTLAGALAQPGRLLDELRGAEDFRYPGAWRLLTLTPEPPDLVHCHNLHGGYFDLRAIAWLSRRVPVVLTLHDAWLLSGHCAHSFDCERWRAGCGHCPDLTIYPALGRDGTAANWRRKRRIYGGSRLRVATPSRWLMRKVEQSMLAPAVLEARVIPHGVDLSVFRPAAKAEARGVLGIPREADLLLFSAIGIRRNVWKDYGTLRAAVARLAGRFRQRPLRLIALGEDAQPERIGEAEVSFVPYQREPTVVARYYQAADIYVHAALADTFPNVTMEALACGTPVVATDVGGIPEQIKGLAFDAPPATAYGADEATGILVPPRDDGAMAHSLERLLGDQALRARLGENAAREAARRFDLRRLVRDYLDWYGDILPHARVPRRMTDSPAPSVLAGA